MNQSSRTFTRLLQRKVQQHLLTKKQSQQQQPPQFSKIQQIATKSPILIAGMFSWLTGDDTTTPTPTTTPPIDSKVLTTSTITKSNYALTDNDDSDNELSTTTPKSSSSTTPKSSSSSSSTTEARLSERMSQLFSEIREQSEIERLYEIRNKEFQSYKNNIANLPAENIHAVKYYLQSQYLLNDVEDQVLESNTINVDDIHDDTDLSDDETIILYSDDDYPYGSNDKRIYTPHELERLNASNIAYRLYDDNGNETIYDPFKIPFKRNIAISNDEIENNPFPRGEIAPEDRDEPIVDILEKLPGQLTFDDSIRLLEYSTDQSFQDLIKQMSMDDISNLLVEVTSRYQAAVLNDQHEQYREQLYNFIKTACQNKQYDILYTTYDPQHPEKTIPPIIEFPQQHDGTTFLGILSDEDQAFLNHSMHIFTHSYFGNLAHQFEGQNYTEDLIQYSQDVFNEQLYKQEELYNVQRKYQIDRFRQVQKLKNEVVHSKRLYDAKIIENMEDRITNKLQFRNKCIQLGLEIQYDPEIDTSLDQTVETRFDMIKNASKLLKELEENENMNENVNTLLPLSNDYETMLDIDEKINTILQSINFNRDGTKIDPTNNNMNKESNTKVIQRGKKIDELSLEELVQYNKIKSEYDTINTQIEQQMVEQLHDAHAFEFQFSNIERQTNIIQDRIDEIDDTLLDFIDSLYIKETDTIRADMNKNMFYYDLQSIEEQHQYLTQCDVIDPIFSSSKDYTLQQQSDSLTTLASIYGPWSLGGMSIRDRNEIDMDNNEQKYITDQNDVFLISDAIENDYYKEARSLIERITKRDNTLLFLRPSKNVPAIEQYKALTRSNLNTVNTLYNYNNIPNYNTLHTLLQRIKRQDNTLTQDDYNLVNDFILDPKRYTTPSSTSSLSTTTTTTTFPTVNTTDIDPTQIAATAIDALYESLPKDRQIVYIKPDTTNDTNNNNNNNQKQNQQTSINSKLNTPTLLLLQNYQQYNRRKEQRKLATEQFVKAARKLGHPPAEIFSVSPHIIKPFDEYYTSFGLIDPNGYGIPDIHKLQKSYRRFDTELSNYYDSDLDIIYGLPLYHFEQLITSTGPEGKFDPRIPFNSYSSLDLPTTIGLYEPKSIAEIPIDSGDIFDIQSLLKSTEYLSRL